MSCEPRIDASFHNRDKNYDYDDVHQVQPGGGNAKGTRRMQVHMNTLIKKSCLHLAVY